MRTRLFLNPSNNKLVGNYPPEAEHIHVVLDSSNAAFSIQLPDATIPEHKEYIFYNIPSSGSGNDVTLLPVTGQFVINSDTSHVLKAGDTVSATADLKKCWLLTDVNAVDPSVVDHNSLSGLQGGTTAEYYHLTNAQVSALHAAVTIADTASVDLSLSGQQISATVLPAGVHHGGLDGLGDDDHTQYHNNTRGDARYPVLVNPSVDNNFVAFNGIAGQQKDSGYKAADFSLASHDNFDEIFFLMGA